MDTNDLINELLSVMLLQNEEIDKLRNKLNDIKRYLEAYEEFLEKENK